MKLNYRDKIILAVVLAVGILLAGYFALIKPKNQELKDDKATLSARESEESQIRAQIAQIPALQDEITQTAKDTNEIAETFVDRESVSDPTRLDQFMQDFANENNMRIENLSVSNMESSSLDYYYIGYNTEIGSNLREGADTNGELQAAVDAINAERDNVSARNVETVLRTQYGVSVYGTKQDLWNFMSAIENCDDAIIINSISFSVRDEEEEDEEEEEATTEAPKGDDEEPEFFSTNIEDDTILNADIVISLYSVYEVEEPTFANQAEE